MSWQPANEPEGKEVKALIKSVDKHMLPPPFEYRQLPIDILSDQMQQEAVNTSLAALEKYTVEKDVAMYIKKEFDRLHGTTWHCVVGKNFGSFVTHETKNFIYFYLGPIAILLWKTS